MWHKNSSFSGPDKLANCKLIVLFLKKHNKINKGMCMVGWMARLLDEDDVDD